jgi:hypothetical protein
MKFQCAKCGWSTPYDFLSVNLDCCENCKGNLELVSS